MLNNWLKPVPLQEIRCFEELSDGQFGKKILIYSKELPSLSNIQLALIGVSEKEANRVREVLYTLSFPFENLRMADLGNIRKKDHSFLIPVIEEFINSGIVPIIIGKEHDHVIAQFQAYRDQNQPVNLSIVDERIDYSTKDNSSQFSLNRLLAIENSHLFNLNYIGYQSHFVTMQALEILEDKNFESVRLGKVRMAIDEIEPLIRDADLMSFSLNSLKYCEAPGVENPTPSGFFSEEACQITRYAGMSDKLSSIGFYGFVVDEDKGFQTAHMVSQLIWYFIDGFHSRKNDFPKSNDGLVEYIVNYKANDLQIRFWKSSKSGRWWMQVPIKIKNKYKRHRLIPCSYNDYQLACRDDFPERLINAYKRFMPDTK